MGERGFSIKADLHKTAWENESFPKVCESCLGENPYVRMMRETHGAACKVCSRPYTVFRWKPGKKARYKRTEICQLCAQMKNVCQTCVLDLQYGLPVEVRDAFLSTENNTNSSSVPMSDANQEWAIQVHAQKARVEAENLEMIEAAGKGGGGLTLAASSSSSSSTYGKAASNKSLIKMARMEPYYQRNLPHLCSFFARGECNRGDECPYLHEMPKSKKDPLAKQNIKDRFRGRNDPVAKKILSRHYHEKTAPTPTVPTIETTYEEEHYDQGMVYYDSEEEKPAAEQEEKKSSS